MAHPRRADHQGRQPAGHAVRDVRRRDQPPRRHQGRDSPRRRRSTARTSASRSARYSTPAARSCPTRSRSASRSSSSMLSLVSALLPPGTDPRSYTPREQANIETVLRLRSAPFSERKNYMHPAMVRHRWGFASLADVTGMKDGAGYDASTCSDRMDTIEDLIAKDDRVWAVWTMRGTHTGQLFGIPATGRPNRDAGSGHLAPGGRPGDRGLVLRRRTAAAPPARHRRRPPPPRRRLPSTSRPNASYGNWAVAAATLTTLLSDSPVTVTKHALFGLGSTSSCDSLIVPALEELSL